MKEDEDLQKALTDFRKQYPNITSADLQTFILGWKAAVNCEHCEKYDASNNK